jgi:hypothetical protein
MAARSNLRSWGASSFGGADDAMNLDARWCDLSVRDYLVIERAWGWGTSMLQLAIVGAGALVVRRAWRWWRARRVKTWVESAEAAQPVSADQRYDTVEEAWQAVERLELQVADAYQRGNVDGLLEACLLVEDEFAKARGKGSDLGMSAYLAALLREKLKKAETGHPLPHFGEEPSTETEGKNPPE